MGEENGRGGEREVGGEGGGREGGQTKTSSQRRCLQLYVKMAFEPHTHKHTTS